MSKRTREAFDGGAGAVRNGPTDYRFTYVSRQVPPLREEGAGQPTSGARGIDYTARTATRPVVGEIKRAEVFPGAYQLIVYLTPDGRKARTADPDGMANLFVDGVRQTWPVVALRVAQLGE